MPQTHIEIPDGAYFWLFKSRRARLLKDRSFPINPLQTENKRDFKIAQQK
jgi:hypothetical protein